VQGRVSRASARRRAPPAGTPARPDRPGQAGHVTGHDEVPLGGRSGQSRLNPGKGSMARAKVRNDGKPEAAKLLGRTHQPDRTGYRLQRPGDKENQHCVRIGEQSLVSPHPGAAAPGEDETAEASARFSRRMRLRRAWRIEPCHVRIIPSAGELPARVDCSGWFSGPRWLGCGPRGLVSPVSRFRVG